MSTPTASKFNKLCNLCRCFSKGPNPLRPMAQGEKFLTLDEDYLNHYDEIVVVGDIHGCFTEFNELLKKVHSETPTKKPKKVLKILLGDLVNKGPENRKVLQLCCDKYSDSIIAVRGNHDETVIRIYNEFKNEKKPLEERNKWIEKIPRKYIQYLEKLPYSITIPSMKCIIVHAGIDPSAEEPAKTTPLYTMTTMRNIVVLKDAKTGATSYQCTKSKDEGAAWALFWPGPEHVYFGHDARRRLQDDHEFATGLDTGCVYGDRLTYKYIKGPREGELCSIPAKKNYDATSKDDS